MKEKKKAAKDFLNYCCGVELTEEIFEGYFQHFSLSALREPVVLHERKRGRSLGEISFKIQAPEYSVFYLMQKNKV